MLAYTIIAMINTLLTSGWIILLSEVNERARMLTEICDNNGSSGAHKFMFKYVLNGALIGL